MKMKIVKISLGIIILISVVFFATGLVVKEIEYTIELTVDKPIEEVFSAFKNVENQTEWMTEVDGIEVVNKNPQEIGSYYRLSITFKGQSRIMKQKVLAYVPNEKLTYRFNSDEEVKTEDYLFKKDGDKTKITQFTKIRSMSYILACTYPWFQSRFRDGSQKYLENFKRFTEK